MIKYCTRQMRDCINYFDYINNYTLDLVCFSLYSIVDSYKQFWTAIYNPRRLHTTSCRCRKLSNIPAIKYISVLCPTNFKLLLFLINGRVHLAFHEKSEENLLLFFLHNFTVFLFCSIIIQFSEEDMNRVTQTMEIYLLAQTREYDY